MGQPLAAFVCKEETKDMLPLSLPSAGFLSPYLHPYLFAFLVLHP